MRVGIAGTDENKRIDQVQAAMAGVVGEAHFGLGGLNDRHIVGAGQQATGFLSPGQTARCAAAGPNTHPIIAGAGSAMGIAGNLGGGVRAEIVDEVVDVAAFRQRDAALSRISRNSDRLGDRAAREAWQKGVWFADFTYVCTPYEPNGGGGYVRNGGLAWRRGRQEVFSRQRRTIPFFIDSCGYRREITGTAPRWARDFNLYPQAIELLDPDGYAAWDYPQDRARTLEALRALTATFPGDVANGRMWPVFSVRWAWDDNAHLDFARLPGWAGKNLAYLVPLNRTQRPVTEATRERWARQALANALTMAADSDFRYMADTFGRVMIGGMVGGPCPRMARHIFAAALCALCPGIHFWLLGQANFAVINGLGTLELLDRVWSDGSWYIRDATAERMATVENRLITMLSLESLPRRRGERRVKQRESFFTLIEMMAANLRSLLAAYQGLWVWPPPEPLPTDLLDVEQRMELKARFQAAQLELGL